MIVLKVTPVRNVLISKRCYRSEKTDLFFSKVFAECAKVEVFDISDRKQKALPVNEINNRYHRIVINDKKYFICSINEG